jgi:hypothetical protein
MKTITSLISTIDCFRSIPLSHGIDLAKTSDVKLDKERIDDTNSGRKYNK